LLTEDLIKETEEFVLRTGRCVNYPDITAFVASFLRELLFPQNE